MWEAISEDDSLLREEYYPDLSEIFAMALVHEDQLHGFVLGRYITETVAEIHVLIHPDLWGHKANVQLGRMACAALFVQMDVHKLVASIPVPDKQVLRYAQRVGLDREGVNKKSFRRNGELLDQYYVGLTREKHEQDNRRPVGQQ